MPLNVYVCSSFLQLQLQFLHIKREVEGTYPNSCHYIHLYIQHNGMNLGQVTVHHNFASSLRLTWAKHLACNAFITCKTEDYRFLFLKMKPKGAVELLGYQLAVHMRQDSLGVVI